MLQIVHRGSMEFIFVISAFLLLGLRYATAEDLDEPIIIQQAYFYTTQKTPTTLSVQEVVKIVRHKQLLKMQDLVPLREIPKKLEVGPENARNRMIKYVNQINKLAEKENVSVIYKVKVDVVMPAKKTGKKPTQKKYKSKKYNVPLKKKNMRLSHFEIIMRKLADTQKVVVNPVMTTEVSGNHERITTTKIPILKYKPIINRIRPNYAKTPIKPIRIKEITLT